MQVVVVESPGKVKSINKSLGPGYKVMASYGHIRDLPSKDGSVKPDEDFAMTWDIDGKSAKHVREIAEAVKNADGLILATDPDREGEAISWHVLEALNSTNSLTMRNALQGGSEPASPSGSQHCPRSPACSSTTLLGAFALQPRSSG
jgi:DNA topoisomerase-1